MKLKNLAFVKRLEDSKKGSFTKGKVYIAYKLQEGYKVKDNNGRWKFAPKSKFEEVSQWDR